MPDDRRGLAAKMLALVAQKTAAAAESRGGLTREEYARLAARGKLPPGTYEDWAVKDMRAARGAPSLDEARAVVAAADAAESAAAEKKERLARPATAADVLTAEHVKELVAAGHISPESAAALQAEREARGVEVVTGPPVHPWPERGLNEYARRMVSDPEGATMDLKALGVSDEAIAKAKVRGERLVAADERAASAAEHEAEVAGADDADRDEARQRLAQAALEKAATERLALKGRGRDVAEATTEEREGARLAWKKEAPGRRNIAEALRRVRPVTRAGMDLGPPPEIPTVPLKMPGIPSSSPLYEDPDAPRIRGAALFPGEQTAAQRLKSRKTGGLSEYDLGRLNDILEYQAAARGRPRWL